MKYAIGFLAGVIITSLFFTFKLKKITEGTPPQSENIDALPSEEDRLPEDFETFYLQFHKDSLYQVEHVLFPLQGLPAQADSLVKLNGNFQWEKEDWSMHKPFSSNNGEFTRDFLDMGNIITEDIYTKEGFGMQRRFMKSNGDWFLIYYSAMNQVAE